MRVRADDLNVAYDRLLPHVRGGLHPLPQDGEVVLVALGEHGELLPPSELAELAGDVLIGEPVEADAGADLASALAALAPRWGIGGRVLLRTPLLPVRRGDLRAHGVTVRARGPLGLASRQRTVPVPGVVRSLPSAAALPWSGRENRRRTRLLFRGLSRSAPA